MKKQLFSITVMLFFSCAIKAMEEKSAAETKKECSLKGYKYKGIPSIQCPLFDEDEMPTLLNEKSAHEMTENIDFMVKQITNTETTHLFADVIELYKNNLRPYYPWRGYPGSIQRNLETAIENYKNGASKSKELQERLEHSTDYETGMIEFDSYSVPVEGLLLEIEQHKRSMRKLMAARVALSLLELNELDQKMSTIQKKLDEAKAKKSETSSN